jgi:hypothetical protein
VTSTLEAFDRCFGQRLEWPVKGKFGTNQD